MQPQTAHQLHQQGHTPADIYAAVDRGELLAERRRDGGWTWWVFRSKQ